MLTLINTLYRSFTDPSVYRENANQPLKKVLFYSLTWYFIVSVAISTLFTIRYFPQVKSATIEAINHIKSTFPTSLSVTIDQNELTTSGSPEPIAITLPENPIFTHHNLIIIDTSQSAETITTTDSFLFASKKALALRVPNTTTPLIIPYKDVNLTGTWTKENLVPQLNMVHDQMKSSSRSSAIFALSLFLLITVIPSRIMYVLLTAFLLHLQSQLLNHATPYFTYVKLCLTTIVAAEIIHAIVILVYGRTFSFIFPIAFIGFSTIAFLSLRRSLKT